MSKVPQSNAKHNDYEKVITTLFTQLVCKFADAIDDRSLLNRANRVLNASTICSLMFKREEILKAVDHYLGDTTMSDDFEMLNDDFDTIPTQFKKIAFVAIFRLDQKSAKILSLGTYDILRRDLPEIFSLSYLKQNMATGKTLTKEAKNDREERKKRKLFEARAIVLLNKF
jgi:hypothetical protein